VTTTATRVFRPTIPPYGLYVHYYRPEPTRHFQGCPGTSIKSTASASFSSASSTGRPGYFFGVSVSSKVGNARSRMSFASADMVILGSGSPSLLFRFLVSISLFRFRVS
jgi:hypothetical protein